MKVVVGLGNPGRKYQGTRHNVGFDVLSELARRNGSPRTSAKYESEIAEVIIGGEKVLLLAPQTYMNLSGRSVGQCVRFFQLPLEDLIVVCDDLNLKLARIRMRPSGSAGGQKGLGNIIQHLGTQDFSRLRIGVGRPPDSMDATDFVLSRFTDSDRSLLDVAVQESADAIETWICEGLQTAMNRFNRPNEQEKKVQEKADSENLDNGALGETD